MVVIAGAAGLFTVRTNAPEDPDLAPAELESVKVTVKVTVALLVGVPEMAPVLELIDRPSESPVADHVSVPEPPVPTSARL